MGRKSFAPHSSCSHAVPSACAMEAVLARMGELPALWAFARSSMHQALSPRLSFDMPTEAVLVSSSIVFAIVFSQCRGSSVCLLPSCTSPTLSMKPVSSRRAACRVDRPSCSVLRGTFAKEKGGVARAKNPGERILQRPSRHRRLASPACGAPVHHQSRTARPTYDMPPCCSASVGVSPKLVIAGLAFQLLTRPAVIACHPNQFQVFWTLALAKVVTNAAGGLTHDKIDVSRSSALVLSVM